jgi:integrase
LIQKSTGETDRQKAKAIEAGLKLRLLADAGAPHIEIGEVAKTISVRELLERWLREHSALMEPTTHYRQKSNVKMLLKFFGDKTIAEVTPALVSEYKRQRMLKAKPATFNRDYDVLTSAFKYAVREWGWAASNPCANVRKLAENNTRTRWLTQAEQEKLIGASPEWLQDIIVFLINTTLREMEALSLTWDRVDVERRTVTIARTTRTKNTTMKVVPLNTLAYAVIVKKWNERRDGVELAFPTESGTLMTRTFINRIYRKARDKAGIAHCTIHDLRHTGASRMVQRGVPLYTVGKVMGTKNPSSVARYAHLEIGNLRDAVAVLDELSSKVMIVDDTPRVGGNRPRR